MIVRANRRARDRLTRQRDGGQLLLLAGFILAGAVIIAMGTYSVIDRTRDQVVTSQSGEMVNLFLNTRARAISFFDMVSAYDTNGSIENQLEGYLSGQYRTARSLSLDLNASLAGEGSSAPDAEEEGQACGGPCTSGVNYDLSAYDGSESYSCVEYDGKDDGLITNKDTGEVYAAILWLRVLSTNGELEEVVVIDVPDTTPPTDCL